MLLHSFNKTPIWNTLKRNIILKMLFGEIKGKPLLIQNSFRCSSGQYISIGTNFYANFNCVILDRADVKIGDNVCLGPNVTITTIGHSLDFRQRRLVHYSNSFEPQKRTTIETLAPVTIGNDVWICSGAVILPGVTIGDGAVIGAGSVVTKDIPSNVLALGSPAKVIKDITDEDRIDFEL